MEKGRGIAVISTHSSDLLHRIKYHFPERSILFDEDTLQVEQEANTTILKRKSADGSFQFPASTTAQDAWSVVTVLNQLGIGDADIQSALENVCA
jgi:hypothetical protein